MSTAEIFASFKDYLNLEQDLREEIRIVVRDIEQTAREVLTILQSVHQQEGIKDVNSLCNQAKPMFALAKQQFETLASKVPSMQYYRFHDHWRFVSQRLVFLVAFTIYLEEEKLATRENVAEILGMHVVHTEGFHLDLDDYLTGILTLANELSRMAVNSVTGGDFSRPLRIAKFMGDLNSGFRLLNLKNDSLRKKFDALKYDIKKVEEVVYDLSIRGLKPIERPTTTGGDN